MSCNQYKILHIVESFGGGCFTAISLLTRYLNKGYKHTILYSNRKETPKSFRDAFPENVQLIPLDMRLTVNPLHFVKTVASIRKVISEVKPQIVHCHSSIAGVYGRIASRLAHVPSLYTPHAYAFLRSDIGKVSRLSVWFIEWVMAKIGTGIVACSEDEYCWARRLSGKGKNVFLVRNAVDLKMLDTHLTLTKTGSNPDKVKVGTCGRIAKQHGIDWFVYSAKQLQDKAIWIWVGASKETTILPDFVEKTGWIDHSMALDSMAQMDIFLHPTQWDGLSYALLEAMALRKAIIVSDIAPNRAVIQNGLNGFIVKDAIEMTKCIEMLIKNPELRHQIGDAARCYVEQNYSADSVRHNYESVCQAICKK